jgi:hypothetical protein
MLEVIPTFDGVLEKVEKYDIYANIVLRANAVQFRIKLVSNFLVFDEYRNHSNMLIILLSSLSKNISIPGIYNQQTNNVCLGES